MKLKYLSSAALAAASLVAGQANAQSQDQQTPAPARPESQNRPAVPPPAPPIVSATVPIPSSGRVPSLHVRCDGNPDNVTAGETAARLLGAVTLLGLFAPPPEASDDSARLEGPAGVAICAQALERESNDVRRAQLILASAIHQIEAGNYEAAITEARRAQSDRPDFSASRYFQLSFALSIMEVETLALAGMGRFDEARAKAMEMAAAAPYDLINTLRASRYVGLGDSYGPAEDSFYEAGIRLYPRLIIERAMARMRARQFAAAAADIELWISVNEMTEGQDDPSFSAFAGLARMAAGDAARAAEHERRARELIAELPAGTTGGLTPAMLDLLQIWRMAREGNVAQARVLFANRTGWEVASGQLVSEVAQFLQVGATPAERVGISRVIPPALGATRSLAIVPASTR